MVDKVSAETSAAVTASIRESLKDNTAVSRFAELGKKLLEETNRPNVITEEQFAPYMPLFNPEKDKFPDKDAPHNEYTLYLKKLFQSWRVDLGINLYEVTYVIESKENPVVLRFIDRTFTRLHSDAGVVNSSRANVPASVPRNAVASREDLIVDASFNDMVNANNTPEQVARISRLQMESSIISKNFTERNMSPQEREALLANTASVETTSNGDDNLGITLDDDED